MKKLELIKIEEKKWKFGYKIKKIWKLVII